MLLFWSPWFKYRFIKIDLVTVGKFCHNFSHVLGGVIDCVNVNHSARARLNHDLRNAQNVCTLTKVSTVLKSFVKFYAINLKNNGEKPDHSSTLNDLQI